MKLDFGSLKTSESYRWLTRLVAPRPIAWVSTQDTDGNYNLAPFSWFQTISSSPPILMIACAKKRLRNGQFSDKDTLLNLEQTRECVVQLAERDQIDALVKTSATLDHGISEFDFANLEAIPSDTVQPPRVKGVKVAFECKLEEIIRREEWNTDLALVRCVCAHLDPTLFKDGDYDSAAFRPISRLGDLEYSEIGERFDIPRPTLPE